MRLSDETWKQAHILLNSAVRRLLLWKDWWRDNRERLMDTSAGSDPFTLGERRRELDAALWRLKSARGDAAAVVDELRSYEQQHATSPSGMPDYEERDEVADLAEGLQDLEDRLGQEVASLKEAEEGAKRLLSKNKDEAATA